MGVFCYACSVHFEICKNWLIFLSPHLFVRTSQGFNWESPKHQWYKTLSSQIRDIAKAGFTTVWLPPPSESVSPQGYLPGDLYKLDSAFGTEAELRQLISDMHDNGLKAVADIVINHRCASFQVPGSWRSG